MEHHDEAIARYIERVRHRPEVLGVLLTGSLARGTERPDSDVDLVLVVTEEAWSSAVAERRIMVVETEGIAYEHGYFDVKLATTAMLEAVAARGDDPARNSLADARVLLDQGFRFEETLAGIRAVTHLPSPDLAASFVAQAALHGGYFLPEGVRSGDPLLTAHAAVHLATAACRAALALSAVPFPGPKQLLETVRRLGGDPAALADACVQVVEHPSASAADHVLELLAVLAGPPPGLDEALSRFVLDNELAWFTGRPAPEFR